MDTTPPETPGYREAEEHSKSSKRSKVIDGISRKHTITFSALEKEARKLHAGGGAREKGQSHEESAVSNLNRKTVQSANRLVFAPELKRIVSISETAGDAAHGEDQTQSPTLVKQIFLNVSITKLLYSLSEFLCRRCCRVTGLLLHQPVQWLHAVDDALVRWGWQEHCFISLPSLVFLYMMCRSVMSAEIDSENKLRQELYICLYLTYSYLGSEVLYPIRPFLLQQDREEFWDRCLEMIQCTSADMLKLNCDSQFFTKFFEDLLSESK